MAQDAWLDALVSRGIISPDAATQALPYVKGAKDFASGGITGALRGAGVQLPEASNRFSDFMQSDDVNAAIGMAMPPAIAGKPEMISKLMEMLEAGSSRQQIADELGVGKGTVNRYLKNELNVTTAEANLWSDPANVSRLKDMASKGGVSQAQMAAEFGTSPGNVASKLQRLQASGEIADYTPVNQKLWSLPETRAKIKELADQGYSQSEIASVIKGGPSGKMQTSRGSVSATLKDMRESGELSDYAPQFGGSAGKTPSLPQFKSTSGPTPPVDADYVNALKKHFGF
jgi:transposase